jgi:hypothetical protein
MGGERYGGIEEEEEHQGQARGVRIKEVGSPPQTSLGQNAYTRAIFGLGRMGKGTLCGRLNHFAQLRVGNVRMCVCVCMCIEVLTIAVCDIVHTCKASLGSH